MTSDIFPIYIQLYSVVSLIHIQLGWPHVESVISFHDCPIVLYPFTKNAFMLSFVGFEFFSSVGNFFFQHRPIFQFTYRSALFKNEIIPNCDSLSAAWLQ